MINFDQIQCALDEERNKLAKQAKSIQTRMQELSSEAEDVKTQLLRLQKVYDAMGLPSKPVGATKRSYTKTGLPKSKKLKGIVRRVLMNKKVVSNKELIQKMHHICSLPMPNKVSSSPLTSKIYSVVAELRKDSLIKKAGTRKITATFSGRNKATWG